MKRTAIEHVARRWAQLQPWGVVARCSHDGALDDNALDLVEGDVIGAPVIKLCWACQQISDLQHPGRQDVVLADRHQARGPRGAR